jgi:TolB-like protein
MSPGLAHVASRCLRAALVSLLVQLCLAGACRAQGATPSTSAEPKSAAPAEQAPPPTVAPPVAAPQARVRDTKNSVAIFEFVTNEKGLEDKAQSVGVLVATRLAQHPGVRVVGADQIRAVLGLEKQRKLLGCTDESCVTEAAGALGVRYVLNGRLDRFGSQSIVSVVLVDSRSVQALARLREDAASEGDLPAAADRVADRAAEAMGLAPAPTPLAGPAPEKAAPTAPAAAPAEEPTRGHLNLKLGQSVAGLEHFQLGALNLHLELEGDYYFSPGWLIYLQVGLIIGGVKNADGTQSGVFSLVPAGTGVKYVFRGDKDLRPYLGLGIGLGFLGQLLQGNGNLGVVSFRVNGLTGLAWVPYKHFGVNLEVGAGVDTRGLWELSWYLGALVPF